MLNVGDAVQQWKSGW